MVIPNQVKSNGYMRTPGFGICFLVCLIGYACTIYLVLGMLFLYQSLHLPAQQCLFLVYLYFLFFQHLSSQRLLHSPSLPCIQETK